MSSVSSVVRTAKITVHRRRNNGAPLLNKRCTVSSRTVHRCFRPLRASFRRRRLRRQNRQRTSTPKCTGRPFCMNPLPIDSK
ncbi:hypothetical protein IB64_006310 [Bacteroides fragilis]|nr:hypothetical protein IB64_006310 [Bacteroides fragilis]